MRNQEQWAPSKFVYEKGRLIASRDRRELSSASQLIGDLVAGCYDEALKLYARGALIDLGCGKVPLYEAYRDLVTTNTCVDWARSLHENAFLDLECDLMEPLPFESESFDTIILSDVLEHVPGPAHLWSEMSRILAPNGHILLNVPFLYWLHEEPHDYYRYTEFALRRFASDAGLEVVVLKPIGGTPELLADLAAKHLVRMPIIGRLVAGAIQGGTLAFVRTRFGRRASRRSSAKFPLGYFLVAAKPSSATPAPLAG
ncbi:MAG: methyltransferase domain-containing protein [Chloroflexota bacterium]